VFGRARQETLRSIQPGKSGDAFFKQQRQEKVMAWHVVRQGEDLKRISYQYAGCHSISDIRNLPENKELFESRQDAILRPGDRIYLPEIEIKSLAAETEQRHRFCRHTQRRLHLKFENESGEPMANCSYELNVEGTWREGTTDDDGWLSEPIPMDAESATLVLLDATYPLNIGHLDPLDTVTGAQARLRNLGLDVGDIDDDFGPMTEAALRAFQEANDLEPTGELDEQTREVLEERELC
jgi:N-acetylmuramoyl-L-alanine amidase